MKALWLLLLLVACATPPQGDVYSPPPPPAPGYANLVIYYDPCCMAGVWPVSVGIAGKKDVASIQLGGYTVVVISAKTSHLLSVEGASVPISTKEGETLYVRYHVAFSSATPTGSPSMPLVVGKRGLLELMRSPPDLSAYKIQPAHLRVVE